MQPISQLNGATGFAVRRALERLREGLYDSLAVRLLTANREALEAQVDADLKRLDAGEPVHLCVSGPYGQGKSHTLTYLREYALERGYVVSAINLDPREAPLHQFRQVYRALLDHMTFPVNQSQRRLSRHGKPGLKRNWPRRQTRLPPARRWRRACPRPCRTRLKRP